MGRGANLAGWILQSVFTCVFFSAGMALFGVGEFQQILFMSTTAMLCAYVARKFVEGLLRRG